jgi:hypothetical protein
MANERQWAEALGKAAEPLLQAQSGPTLHITTEDLIRHTTGFTGHLPDQQPVLTKLDHEFTTDLLVWEDQEHADGLGWVPRVVVEIKFFTVSNHDALAFMAKAERHRQVYPCVRTALVIPGLATLPPRLPLLADRFDLMMAVPGLEWDETTLADVTSHLAEEVTASRALERLMGQRTKGGPRVVRRGLTVV